MTRVSIEIPADILAQLDETADEIFASRSAALRLHWKRYRQLLSDSTSNMTDASKIDTGAHGSDEGAHSPSHTLARAGTDPEKKEEEKEKKKKGSQVAGAIVSRVVGRINSLRPKVINGKRVTGFAPAAYESDVGLLLKKGNTEIDMITVVEWKAEECKRRNDWQYFKPDTLFRSTKFRKKLDEALAGVEVRGFGNDQPTNQADLQDYTPETGRTDGNDF